MTAESWTFAAIATAGAVVWLALYRLPLRRPRVRQRFRLAVASATGIPARLVFPIFGTVIYLVTGVLAIAAVTRWGAVPLGQSFTWRPDNDDMAIMVLVIVGAASATAFAMSMLYNAHPRADVPAAVADVAWIREVLVLPPRWRWLVPMVSASVEEVFFRGVFLVGLLAHGAGVWPAVALSGALFVIVQVLLTERGLAAFVLGVSSVVLSVLCGLLVVVTGSVIPAVLVHASFAGYYTNLGTSRRLQAA